MKRIVLMCVFLFAVCFNAAGRLEAGYDDDIKYYEKTAKAQNLTPNDRIFILMKIREKHANSGADLSWLDSEIDRLARLKKLNLPDESKAEEPKVKETVKEAVQKEEAVEIVAEEGKITNISASEENGMYVVAITLKNPGKIKHFMLTDPKGRHKPKIVVDIENAFDAVDFKKKDFNPGIDALQRIKIGMFQESPVPVARVIVDLDKERKYKFDRNKFGMTVMVQGDKKMKVIKNEEPAEAVPEPPAQAPKAEEAKPPRTVDDIKASYKIQPGDIILVDVSPAKELSKETKIDSHGFVELNLIGKVNAAGMTAVKLTELVKNKLDKFVKNPSVEVNVVEYGQDKVFTIGEVEVDMELPYEEGINLYDWIRLNGGFSYSADLRNITIHRNKSGKRDKIFVDLERLILSREEAKSPLIEPGDIIEVPSIKSTVYIMGEVEKPGQYEIIDQNLTLMKLLAKADGHTKNAYLSRIIVSRQLPDGSVKKMKVNLQKILKGSSGNDIKMLPGDIVYIPRKK